jgi:hypothetical protein
MAGFRGVAVALVVALLTTGISYAVDKVTRSCSGTANHVFWSLKGEHNEQNYPYQDSLTIDLDGRVVIWGSDTYNYGNRREPFHLQRRGGRPERGGTRSDTRNSLVKIRRVRCLSAALRRFVGRVGQGA